MVTSSKDHTLYTIRSSTQAHRHTGTHAHMHTRQPLCACSLLSHLCRGTSFEDAAKDGQAEPQLLDLGGCAAQFDILTVSESKSKDMGISFSVHVHVAPILQREVIMFQYECCIVFQCVNASVHMCVGAAFTYLHQGRNARRMTRIRL